MSTIITFVSQKGGVGKTTSAINLATALAFGGYTSLLIDLDPQGSIRFSMGVKNAVTQGTREIFLSPETALSQLTQTTEQENLSFIFANIDSLADEKTINEVAKDGHFLFDRLQKEATDYDFVVIDAPASTNNMAVNAIYASDLIILPLQCESLAVKSLKRFLRVFNELQKKNDKRTLKLAGILLTMFDRNISIHRKVSKQIYKSLTDSVFETIIPRDKAIVEASALGKSVINYNLNSIGAIAHIRLMNELVDKFNLR
ncbi:MAG: ParA family protein [Deltaproteobacteria bacterium]|nr:ParA family protein [Deltaproteobacteria bacterium]